MSELEQAATPENVVETPAPVTPDTVESGTTESQQPVAEPTDEERNADALKQREENSKRQLRGVAKRISELTSDKYQLARQNEALLDLVRRSSGNAQPAPTDGAPQRDQFADYETFLEARAEWKAERKAEALVAKWQETQAREAQQQSFNQQSERIQREFVERQSAFAKANPDYAQVVLQNDDVELPGEALALIPMLRDGHIAAYAIGKNPDLARQLWGAPPIEQAAILGRIAATFQSKPAPQVSNAPPPGQPVAARGGASSGEPSDSDDYETWVKKRNAQIKAGKA